MTDSARPSVRWVAFHLALLWLGGAGMRLTISALPVLLLGLAAVPGSLTIARLGAERSCVLGLTIVAVAGAARGIGPSTTLLFAMTLAMGLGVALLQPTLPSLVGAWFPNRAGLATAVYANGFLIAEAVPPTITIPVVLPWVGGSWGLSFVVWSAPV